jgi:hypothetical protein
LAKITKKLTTPDVFPSPETLSTSSRELGSRLNEFSQLMADDIRLLLRQLGKAQEELRNVRYEIGCMLALKSKFGPTGEFDPEW